ncbi:MAG: T9SS type A sorting domain-containing protein, partial [Bacteroidales bacterium]|nr:T9SS type A sorting domain-containing protein [Bacteroidales bacterium]
KRQGNNSTNIPVRVYNNTGTGGSPGSTALATQNVSLGTIKNNVTAQAPTIVTFTTPVTVTTPFYVAVGLPTAAGDTVALYMTETSTNYAWEQWNTNAWYPFSSTDTWNMNALLAIWPIMCPTGTYINELNNTPVTIYPNPAYDGISVVFPYPADTKVDITITDIYGRVCLNKIIHTEYGDAQYLDLSNLSNGIYVIKGESKYGKFIERISIIK